MLFMLTGHAQQQLFRCNRYPKHCSHIFQAHRPQDVKAQCSTAICYMLVADWHAGKALGTLKKHNAGCMGQHEGLVAVHMR
jgi:hypothetical protein